MDEAAPGKPKAALPPGGFRGWRAGPDDDAARPRRWCASCPTMMMATVPGRCPKPEPRAGPAGAIPGPKLCC